tara:strand:- start:1259 stop:2431 length:1173 start_codon:yes stop_codon:yes gene_type:complete
MIFLKIIILIFSFLQADLKLLKINDGFIKPIYVTSLKLKYDYHFVVEQDGIIHILKNHKKNPNPFLDISDRVHQTFYPADERGLLGLAFHPKFSINGYFYVNYIDQEGYTIISRFQSNEMIVNMRSEKILLKILQPYSNHNGGHLDFGPDGYLYISVGDGGSSGDPENRAQNLDNYFGKILRIDVDQGDPYSIPTNNPFVGKKNVKEEIWSYGLRNVWRFSFDKLNGDKYLGDVGQNNFEEIDFESSSSKGGLNFGWKVMEGFHCFEFSECDSKNMTLPIYEYPNNANYIKTLAGFKQKNRDGCSVTGGYVYRGNSIPELYGKYIFGDYCTGKVWSFNHDGLKINNFVNHTNTIMNSIDKKSFYLSSFGSSQDGELFLIDYSGILYQLID